MSADFGFQSRNIDLHVIGRVLYVVEVIIPNAGVGVLDVLDGLYGGGVYSVHLVSFVLCKVVIGVKYLDSLGDLCKARYVFRDSVKFCMCDAVEQMIVGFVRLVAGLSDVRCFSRCGLDPSGLRWPFPRI